MRLQEGTPRLPIAPRRRREASLAKMSRTDTERTRRMRLTRDRDASQATFWGQVLGTGAGLRRAGQGSSSSSSERATKPHRSKKTRRDVLFAGHASETSASMVRRGSTVRLRQRALTKAPQSPGFRSSLGNAIRRRSHQGRTRFRTRLPNRLLRRQPLGAFELVKDVPALRENATEPAVRRNRRDRPTDAAVDALLRQPDRTGAVKRNHIEASGAQDDQRQPRTG
jgi:hypothetical protein